MVHSSQGLGQGLGQRPGRVGQSRYWTVFGINMVLMPVLLFGGLYALFNGEYATGLVAIVLIVPLGIYFRVTMMRRCRDIGWPAFLPWMFFVVPIVLGVFGGIGQLGGQAPTAASLPMLGLPLIVSIGDFVFSIVIGCIKTKEDADYSDIFGGAPAPTGPATPLGEPGHDRFDDAIARALAAHRQSRSEPAYSDATYSEPEASARPEPTVHARAVAGFGRKAV